MTDNASLTRSLILATSQVATTAQSAKAAQGAPVAPQWNTLSDDEKEALFLDICDELAQGQLLGRLRVANNVTGSQWWRYHETTPERRAIFARARIAQAHALAEMALMTAQDAHGESNEEVQARRLEVDTIKWLTSKIAPRIYGDKLELSGESVRVGVIALPEEQPPEL